MSKQGLEEQVAQHIPIFLVGREIWDPGSLYYAL